MSLGNFALGGTASFGDNFLNLPVDGWAVTSLPHNSSGGANHYSISFCGEIVTVYTSTGYMSLICQAGSGQLTDNVNSKWCIGIRSKKIFFKIRNSKVNATNASYVQTFTDATERVDGEKLVIDITFDGAAIKIYVNGVLKGQLAITTNILSTYYVGLKCNTDASGFKSNAAYNPMKVYALNFYDRCLTPEEIEQNFKSYNERFELGL